MKDNQSLYTAFQVTLTLLAQSKKAPFTDLIPSDAVLLASQYLSQTKEGKKHLSIFKSPIKRWCLNTLTEWWLPGYPSFLLMRKRYVEQKVEAFLEAYPNGQVVNIGAGLDTLLSRLARRGISNRLIEIDYPLVMDLKKTYSLHHNLIFSGADLSQTPIERVLEDSGFNPKEPVLFLLEGVLMYLPEALAFDLLQTLARLSESSTELLFSAVREDERLFSKNVKRVMEKNNSPFQWGKELAPLASRLSGVGFSLQEQASHEEFYEQFSAQFPMPRVFVLYEYYNYAVKT
ncbi:MAG: class I SAM-dependent methyltransferase [Cellvibrionales bacterium]|nr:class I SAM-dependent methyltransferase [Cellvibrionales bacterium]